MDCTIYGADLHLVDAPKNGKFFKSVLSFGLGLTILSEQLKFHLLTILSLMTRSYLDCTTYGAGTCLVGTPLSVLTFDFKLNYFIDQA